SELFVSGVRSAINAGLSVSRVGGSTQINAVNIVASTLRLALAVYRELESCAQFDSDFDDTTAAILFRGPRTVEVLKQGENKPLNVERQVAILYALVNGHLDDIPVEDITRFEDEFLSWLDSNNQVLLDGIRDTKQLPDDEAFVSAISSFKKLFNPSK